MVTLKIGGKGTPPFPKVFDAVGDCRGGGIFHRKSKFKVFGIQKMKSIPSERQGAKRN